MRELYQSLPLSPRLTTRPPTMVRKRKHQQAIEGDDNGDVPDEDYPGDLSATQTREFLREGPPAKHARRVLKSTHCTAPQPPPR